MTFALTQRVLLSPILLLYIKMVWHLVLSQTSHNISGVERWYLPVRYLYLRQLYIIKVVIIISQTLAFLQMQQYMKF